VTETAGTTTLTHNGVTKPLTLSDTISLGDTLTTGADGHLSFETEYGSNWSLGPNTSVTVDQYSMGEHSAVYNALVGAFEYTSGLIAKPSNPDVNVETPVGTIGIRGTQFIARRGVQPRTIEIALIHGSLALTPKLTKKTELLTGPIKIVLSDRAVSGSALTQEEYDAMKLVMRRPSI